MSKLYAMVTIECGENDPKDPMLRRDITAGIEELIERDIVWIVVESAWRRYPELICLSVEFSVDDSGEAESGRAWAAY